MREYIIRRLWDSALTLFGIIVFNFFLFRMMPGDPVSILARSARLTPEMVSYLERLYGVNEPMWVQFFVYIKNLLTFDLGLSFMKQTEVLPLLLNKMANSVLLFVASSLLAIIIGIILGLFAGWYRGKSVDVSLLVFSLFCWSMPTFWLAMVVASAFAGYLPISGMISPTLAQPTFFVYIFDLGKHLILPTFVLTVLYIGSNLLLTRNEVTNILTQDYITTAKAKGVKPFRIIIRHVLRNASLPLLSNAALSLAFLIAGGVQTEIIFSWPGIGRLIYEAALARDYPVLQGAFYFLALSVLLANFLADITYKYIDPRVKY